MRLRSALIFLTLTLALAAAACAPVTPGPPGDIPATGTPGAGEGDQGNIPQTGGTATEEQVRQAVEQFLTTQFNAAANSIESIAVTEAEWPDACLGLGGSESCAQVVTPGWRVTARVNGQDYELRTNQDATIVRLNLGGEADTQEEGDSEGEGSSEDSSGRDIGGDDTTGTGNTADSGLDTASGNNQTGSETPTAQDQNEQGGGETGDNGSTGGDTTGDSGDGTGGGAGTDAGSGDTSDPDDDTQVTDPGSGDRSGVGADEGGGTADSGSGGAGGDDPGAGGAGTDDGTGTAGGDGGADRGGNIPATGGIQVYLVQQNGDAQAGTAFGTCGDVLVGVPTTLNDSGDVADNLRRAYQTLFSLDQRSVGQQGLSSVFAASTLRLESVTVNRDGAAVIRLFGDLKLQDNCDEARARYQLEEVARQFTDVTAVQIYINDRPLDAVLESDGTSSE